MPIDCQRAAFDLPEDVAYLNAAFMSPLPNAAVAAAEAAARAKARPWSIRIPDFFDGPEEVRRRVGRLIGAPADAIAITPSVSYGMSIAARNLPVAAGQTIVVMDQEFPSNVLVWRRKAAVAGAQLVTVKRAPGAGWAEALVEAIGPNTAVVAAAQTHWIDGGVVDLAAVGAACRRVGAGLALDLTQSLGVQPFDLAAVDPDFIAAAGYKWMLGPYTLAHFYAAPRHWEGEPIEEAWLSRDGVQDFAKLADCTDAFAPGARRFDMGERAHFHVLPLCLPGLDMLNGWTPLRLSERLGELCGRLAAAAARAGLEPTPAADRAPHYLTAALPVGAAPDLVERLARAQVHLSRRGDRLRITPHVYTTEADVARFEAALAAALAGAPA